jgi:hypothetical protein
MADILEALMDTMHASHCKLISVAQASIQIGMETNHLHKSLLRRIFR